MNEELKQKAQEALATFIQDALNVREFAIEQAPDVVQQLLLYKFWYSFAGFTLCILGMVSAAIIIMLIVKKIRKDNACDEAYVFIVFPALILVLPSMMCLGRCLGWAQIWIAPKVWLMEYAAGLIK